MTVLRKRMLEELQRRRYSSQTIRLYLSAVKHFAIYFGKRPDHLGSEHLRQYQLYLLNERKLSVCTRQLLKMALALPIPETDSPTSTRLCPACQTPLIVVERLTAAQIAWRFISKCYVDTS